MNFHNFVLRNQRKHMINAVIGKQHTEPRKKGRVVLNAVTELNNRLEQQRIELGYTPARRRR